MLDGNGVKMPMKPGAGGAGNFDQDPFAQYQTQGASQPKGQLGESFEFGGQKPAQYSSASAGRAGFTADAQLGGQSRAGFAANGNNAAAMQNLARNNPELLEVYNEYRKGNPRALDRLGNVDKGKIIADLMEAKDDPKKLEEMALLDKESFSKKYAAEGQTQNPPQTTAKSFLEKYFGWMHPSFWRPYFDFDQDVIAHRIKLSVVPVGNLGEEIKSKPDFFGPIWYLITLIFALTVLSNLARFLGYMFESDARLNELATFKFTLLFKSSAVCFGTWLLAPATFLVLLYVLGQRLNGTQVAEMYCIWGYSYIFYIFATIVCIIPSKTLSFVAHAAAAAACTLMLLHQFNGYLRQFTGNSKYVVLGLIAGWQFLIFLIFRFTFY